MQARLINNTANVFNHDCVYENVLGIHTLHQKNHLTQFFCNDLTNNAPISFCVNIPISLFFIMSISHVILI